MKRTVLLTMLLSVIIAGQAQWTDDHATNTKLASSSNDAGEIYLATNEVTGDTYLQWSQFGQNGWSPTLQRINAMGEPQWGNSGIHPSYHTMASYSQGFAMATTTDNAVVSCFATSAEKTIAIKINPDGTYAWGEEGISVFEEGGNSRTELLAGDDGGVWALGTDLNNGCTYIRYIESDGTLNPTITISDSSGKMCMFGLLVPTTQGVFVVYEKETWAYTYYYHKEIWVEGYNKNGEAISAPACLMTSQTIGGSYRHYVVPDGLGGGYAYIWHPAIGEAFNTYVFHFNQEGVSTITNDNGVSVHSDDPSNFYLDAYATVDPISHDLIIAYQQTDQLSQSENNICINRITTTGERVWGDGKRVYGDLNRPVSDLTIDAFEDGSGFSLVFNRAAAMTGTASTVEAMGFDMDGNQIWSTNISSTSYSRTLSENSTGFHQGQNIVAWNSNNEGGIYGQNIHPDGTLGIVTEPQGCPGPEGFQGEYLYDDETQNYGTFLSWDEPEQTVEWYRLYRTNLANQEETIIEFEGGTNEYFDPVAIGSYKYQLKALYADVDCGFSLPATTPNGDDFVQVEVTSVPEHANETIVTVLKTYTLTGQQIRNTNPEELSTGVYIIQGLTRDGKLINQKIYIP